MGLRSLRLTQGIVQIKEVYHHFMSARLIPSTFFKGRLFVHPWLLMTSFILKKDKNDFLIKPTQGRRMDSKHNNAGNGNQMLLTNTEKQKHKHNDTQI